MTSTEVKTDNFTLKLLILHAGHSSIAGFSAAQRWLPLVTWPKYLGRVAAASRRSSARERCARLDQGSLRVRAWLGLRNFRIHNTALTCMHTHKHRHACKLPSLYHSLVPRPLLDFISQPRRTGFSPWPRDKVWEWPGDEATTTRLFGYDPGRSQGRN